MNKTLVITTIVLVAVVMGMSSIAPAILVYAEHDKSGFTCPPSQQQGKATIIFTHRDVVKGQEAVDHNGNGDICLANVFVGKRIVAQFLIDDIEKFSIP